MSQSCFLALISFLLWFPVANATTTSTTATASVTSTATTPPQEVVTKAKPIAPPGFEPIAGKQDRAESVNADILVAASYGSIFILLLGYLVVMYRDRQRINRELETLRGQITSAESES